MSNDPVEKGAVAIDDDAHAFVPLLEVAATLNIEPTTVRRWRWSGKVGARLRGDGRGHEIDVRTLPPKYRATFIAKLPALASGLRAVVAGDNVERYVVARETVRERAERRLEAVLSLRRARAARQPAETYEEVECRWLRNFRRTHPGMRVSVRRTKEWDAAYASGGLDALVDGNDGSKQRGVRIPALAKQMFKDEYLRAHRPNLRLCYSNVCKVADEKGWGAMPSYHAFRRYAISLPKLVRKLLRENADDRRGVLPYVVRDPFSIPAYHTIQSDHREIDVPVRCDTGCTVCTGRKPRGHFPIWTVFFDVTSRRIVGSEISIDAPNSDLILSVFRRVVDENGLPKRIYIDNGSDYRKAFGKRLRRAGRAEWDGPNEEQLQARFAPAGLEVIYALPYNAQAKSIESLNRSFRRRFDEDFSAFRASLGETSELARELLYRPSDLPTLSELAYLLQLAIGEYNSLIPHTGKGMNGRTPDEVFFDESVRMPRRTPDKAWAYLFFEPIKGGRIVDQNGIRFEKRTYRLESLEKHLEYFGERVDVRINPDDPRYGIALSRTTGEYICNLAVDPDDATYSTRDAVTRELIARVFHDGRELQQMAAAHVEGASERFAEYRRARIAYLKRRLAEVDARRSAKAANSDGAVVLIPQLSAAAREIELTESAVARVLDDADEATATSALCVPAERRPKRATSAQRGAAPQFTYAEIVKRLGISNTTLHYYRTGVRPWPAGMRERFDQLERLRCSPVEVTPEMLDAIAPKGAETVVRERHEGAASWPAVAAALGTNQSSLWYFRTGRRPWPAGMKEKFDELLAQFGRSDTRVEKARTDGVVKDRRRTNR